MKGKPVKIQEPKLETQRDFEKKLISENWDV